MKFFKYIFPLFFGLYLSANTGPTVERISFYAHTPGQVVGKNQTTDKASIFFIDDSRVTDIDAEELEEEEDDRFSDNIPAYLPEALLLRASDASPPDLAGLVYPLAIDKCILYCSLKLDC